MISPGYAASLMSDSASSATAASDISRFANQPRSGEVRASGSTTLLDSFPECITEALDRAIDRCVDVRPGHA
jgi:hypothetical protein